MSASAEAAAAPYGVAVRELRSIQKGLAGRASGGWLLAGGTHETARSSPFMAMVMRGQTDFTASRKYLTCSELTSNDARLPYLRQVNPWPFELTGVSNIIPSPSGRLLAIVRSENDVKADKKKLFIEIWDGVHLAQKVDTSSAHGNIYAEGWFEGFEWHSSEEFIVYVAEPNPDKTFAFWDAAPSSTSVNRFDGSPVDAAFGRGREFDLREDWGEKYVGCRLPSLYLLKVQLELDVESSTSAGTAIKQIFGIPESLSVGQVTFSPDGFSVVFTAWSSEPRRFGMIYCHNRPCKIYSLYIQDLLKPSVGNTFPSPSSSAPERNFKDATPICGPPSPLMLLTPDDVIAKSPRFSPCGSVFIYLAADATGTHNTCFRLRAALWRGGPPAGMTPLDVRTVVEVVGAPPLPEAYVESAVGAVPSSLPAAAFPFPGLFLDALPRRCWSGAAPSQASVSSPFSGDGEAGHTAPFGVFLTSQWRSASAVVFIDLTRFWSCCNRNPPSDSVEAPVVRLFGLARPADGDRSENRPDVDGGGESLDVLDVLPISAPTEGATGAQRSDGTCWLLVKRSSPCFSAEVEVWLVGETVAALAEGGRTSGCGEMGRSMGVLMSAPTLSRRTALRSAEGSFRLRSAPLPGLRWQVLQVQPEKSKPDGDGGHESSAGDPFEAIYVAPPPVCSLQEAPLLMSNQMLGSSAEGASESGSPCGASPSAVVRPPLVVFVHGGPHSAFSTAFSHQVAYLASIGAAVLMVNYRGSTGFGLDFLRSLPGRVGFQDVADCVSALRCALALNGAAGSKTIVDFDPERVAITGGSHGGFLTAHLIGQYPLMFKAAMMRNPVTSLPAMVAHTDIPDWCHVEGDGFCSPKTADLSPNVDLQLSVGAAGCVFGAGRTFATANPVQLSRWFNASPVAHVHKVVTPTLILLGRKDRRVPALVGEEFYHLLRAQGTVTRLIVYPDDVHALDQPSTDADAWINMALWLWKYL